MSDSQPPDTNPHPVLPEALPDPGIEAFKRAMREVLEEELRPIKRALQDVTDDRLQDHERVNRLWEDRERRTGSNGATQQ